MQMEIYVSMTHLRWYLAEVAKIAFRSRCHRHRLRKSGLLATANEGD
jgi:hypothetical protein